MKRIKIDGVEKLVCDEATSALEFREALGVPSGSVRLVWNGLTEWPEDRQLNDGDMENWRFDDGDAYESGNEEAEKPRKPGDVVRLRSGGPEMTVTFSEGGRVCCIWFDIDGRLQGETFLPTSLEVL